MHLQHGGEVSVRDIQVFTNLEKSRVSRAVSRLEAAGLVDKNLSVADARLVEIGLSDKGRAVLDELLPIASAVEAQLLEGVPPSDLQTFFSVLEHFHRVLDEDPLARSRPRPPFATDTGKGPAER